VIVAMALQRALHSHPLDARPRATGTRLLALLLLTTLLLGACTRSSDEEQISQAIAAISEAVENKEFMAIQAHLHESFRANQRMDAKQLKQLLALYAMQHKKLGVTVVSSRTTVDPVYPDRASTVMSVVMTGSSARLPSDGSVRTVEVEWIKDGGTWLVRTATWRDD